MRIFIKNINTKARSNSSEIILVVFILLFGIFLANVIVDFNIIYFGIILLPFLIYLAVEKPFIFPFGAYVFLLPFDSVLSVVGSAKGATLTKFLGVLTILVLLLKGIFENKLRKPNIICLWWLLFILYGCVSLFWAIEQSAVMSRIPTAVGLLILYLIVASYQITESEYQILKLFIVAGAFLGSLFLIYLHYKGIFVGGERTTITIGDRIADPNGIAFCLLIPITVCMEMILRSKKTKMVQGLFLIIFGIITFGVILTGSRGGLLGVLIIFIVYILFSKQRKMLGALLVLITVVSIIFTPDFFIDRIKDTIETHSGAGRESIWKVGLLMLKKYWMLGAGLNNFHFAYNDFAFFGSGFKGFGRGSHNIYLGNFVEMGVLGFSFMILAMWKHYQSIYSKMLQEKTGIIMLKSSFWAILATSFFLDTCWTKSFWLLWVMIIIHENIMNKENSFKT
ncbi:MAG: O-antigen ligase family protein [Candidatus Kuenenia sp.]|nr:O-antigen ligase family protein [Candidatus Kuenenia hertensis]